MSATPRYASVVLDWDSTVSGIEGVDWLAARRGPALATEIAALTDRAMNGEIPLDAIYGERLALIRPSAADLAALAEAYAATFAPGVAGAVARLRSAGVAVAIVSGGVAGAILPCSRMLDFADGEVHAVGVRLDADGAYAGYDTASPLVTQEGKRTVVRSLARAGALPAPVLALGDGATDAVLAKVVDAFVAFTGFARREPVVRAAAAEARSFDDLIAMVL